MSALDRVRLDFSPLTGTMRLARTGKDKNVALETRECLPEFLAAFVAYCTHDSPKGVEFDIRGGGEVYHVSCARKDEPTTPKEPRA